MRKGFIFGEESVMLQQPLFSSYSHLSILFYSEFRLSGKKSVSLFSLSGRTWLEIKLTNTPHAKLNTTMLAPIIRIIIKIEPKLLFSSACPKINSKLKFSKYKFKSSFKFQNMYSVV